MSRTASARCPEHEHAEDHWRHCDRCRDVASILPKLARPGWVWQIGTPADQAEARTLADLDTDKLTRRERVKRAKARHKAAVRASQQLVASMFGARTRHVPRPA